MYYLLTFIGGFVLAFIIQSFRRIFSETKLILEMGRTFGIDYSPDWDIFRQKEFAIKVLTRVGMNSRMEKSCEKVQAEIRDEWRKLK